MCNALEELPGVAKVDIDANQRTATVHAKADEFDSDQAIASLKKAGYDSSLATE